ncbi:MULTISPECIES: 4-hydroxybenzoate octaprenyltransferase [unclassified Oceanobacter]|jgi:4-hydroxybenzoate polyprenyltransferase|uniref:4-hydroxybenzoate octaprenyltransferase n=1 Tax=unclassified Oceanobacter TaxID=2620260 RepID=UPI0026E3DE7E|nr:MULTISPECIES: 4-hydroxybenzoate octaprenyltransferase [unclassified Oceanobacter]MDO6683408.1 4-hydroxybenzoate octaprenyltransferase [Oceanobacter sp. 5_MG-2023]MDP2506882.1 4-hydroxybenzoate octaprenyltransferase [Oceanobacter sp. 3_MG-2023]MDP2547789.1 4-hydroxybenzoate octaprenyltransferase [Oceanobacter sp. 4_MG-2023]MDP2608435.1 4-hydroxybenzoate octaprenyltransferase [Oceanobacter sp. 1_MG-2023]MDP2611530.1 4-hydroxybenzoate octaprenyltransferase [Oceanobacter sp. 2_MG-2023]
MQSPLSASLNKLWPNWYQWVQLTRLNRPIGSYLLLWPTLWALWIAAEGIPSIANLVIFTLGVFLMRSAGCVINDYADRHIDRHVKRTQDRPLTQGRISDREALSGFIVLCLISLALVLLTNALTIWLSLGGVALAALYPFMKRHTHLPQVFLGAAFSWAIPMAFAAQANELTAVCWLLFIANVCWTVGYDTIYAMVDRDDDLLIGVKSTAILFGDLDVTMIAILYGMAHFCLLLTGNQLEASWPFYLAWCVAGGYLVWQLWSIRSRRREACMKVFLAAHWYGTLIWAGLLSHYALSSA